MCREVHLPYLRVPLAACPPVLFTRPAQRVLSSPQFEPTVPPPLLSPP